MDRIKLPLTIYLSWIRLVKTKAGIVGKAQIRLQVNSGILQNHIISVSSSYIVLKTHQQACVCVHKYDE